ncbi:class I SAM-dependent methyltransferase [Thalassiella azotivora]
MPALPPAGSLARSVALLRAFRREQTDPDHFYGVLATDSVREVERFHPVRGSIVLDVGGGPGYFRDAFTLAGARYSGLDPSVGELSARGDTAPGMLRASGTRIPVSDAAVDVAYSSNVLEHVAEPEEMAREMVRVTRPGGLVYLSWTTWLSPWGGHETAPWHYLGGRRAADRYARRHGHRPKNDYGTSLFALSAGRMLTWARRCADTEVVSTYPRYHPAWARWVAHVPGLRELACWNVVIVLRRR